MCAAPQATRIWKRRRSARATPAPRQTPGGAPPSPPPRRLYSVRRFRGLPAQTSARHAQAARSKTAPRSPRPRVALAAAARAPRGRQLFVVVQGRGPHLAGTSTTAAAEWRLRPAASPAPNGGRHHGGLRHLPGRGAGRDWRARLVLPPVSPLLPPSCSCCTSQPARRSRRRAARATGASPPSTRRFCFPCITRWAEVENTCPFCKSRFSRLRRKRLAPKEALVGLDPLAELPGEYLDTQTVQQRNQVRAGRMCVCCCWLLGLGSLHPSQHVGVRWPAQPPPPPSCNPRKQRAAFQDPNFSAWIESLNCMLCGGGENEEQLVLCDGAPCARGGARGRVPISSRRSQPGARPPLADQT